MSGKIYDLFAGPGGWDMGARTLGLDPIGFEWDDAACATRRAVGLKTMQCDVAAVDFASGFDSDGLWGLIASPPCQAWSMAGKGGGQRDKEHVVACAMELAAGNDTRAEHAALCEDPRSILVVEPLRWALHFRPRWLAFEQVPPVLELWTLFAQILSGQGYSTWAGVLEAERYGVPQTRERAILMGSLDESVAPPRATHQRYIKGEPPRHDVTFEGEVLPWVSMAQALGWDEGGRAYRLARGEGMLERHGDRRAVPDEEPALLITSKARTATWDDATVRTGMNSMSKSRDPQDMEPYERPVSDPAPTVDGKVGTAWKVATPGEHHDAPQRWKFRNGSQDNACQRDPDEPAGTLFFGHQLNSVGWIPTHYDQRQTGARPRPVDEPAPTMLSEGLAKGVPQWVEDRPAPTVCGDARGLPEPKHRKGTERQWNENAVRVTVEEASILQTFPPDYPWQGSRTKQFEQIGNAVPPMLAAAVLGALVPANEKRLAA